MAVDTTIPLNFLTGKMTTPIYSGTPMTDFMKLGQAVKEKADTQVKATMLADREEKVRQALSEAIQSGVSLDKAAQAVAKYDPELAFKLMKEFRQEQADLSTKANASQPNVIRQQLRMARDAAYDASNNTELSSAVRNRAKEELLIITNEMAKPYPDAQVAYQAINALYNGKKDNNSNDTTGTDTSNTSYDDILNTINTTIDAIPYKGKDLDKASSTLVDLVKKGGFEKADEDDLLAKITQLSGDKVPAPKAPARPNVTSKDINPSIMSALTELITSSKVSSQDRNNPTGKQLIFKVAQRTVVPEAVNEGDVVNASSWWQKLMSKAGAPITFSDDQLDASIFAIKDGYQKAVATLNDFISDENPDYFKSISGSSVNLIKNALKNYKLTSFGSGTRNQDDGGLPKSDSKIPSKYTDYAIKYGIKNVRSSKSGKIIGDYPDGTTKEVKP